MWTSVDRALVGNFGAGQAQTVKGGGGVYRRAGEKLYRRGEA